MANILFLKNYFFVFILITILSLLAQSIYNPFFVLEEINYLFQPYDLRGFAKGVIYIISYILSILGIVLLIGIRSKIAFLMGLAYLFFVYSIDFFIQLIGSTPGLSTEKITLALNEAGNYKYLIAYLNYIAYAILYAILYIFCLFIIRKKLIKKKLNSILLILLVFPILGTYYTSIKISSVELSSFPAFSKAISLIIYQIQHPFKFKERVLGPDIQVINKSNEKNIIWIIDESICGSYLSINGYEKDTTPYLSMLEKMSNNISNYGIVNSVSNCSSPSNFYLRLGMNPRLNLDLETDMLNFPTIYQYAKRAGYETYLLDSQAAKDKLQNNLSIYDVKYIDHFETLNRNILQKDRDKVLLNSLSEILRKNKTKKKFIVMVKFGSHFPYLLSYDNSNTFFTPVMDVSYGGITLENKEKLINTYLNSIRNNTDLYIKDMLTKINVSDTIIFYTSDHGQNIMETDSKSVHCNEKNIPKNEVTVPLLVFSENAKIFFPVDKDKNYSQIQIFPTTLSLMGYDKSIVNRYGVTLWEGLPKTKKRKYFIIYTKKIAIFE